MKFLLDDIPYNLHAMVEIVGEEKFLEIARLYGGSNLYIPVYNKVIMKERNREIAKEFNGKNLDILRLRYGMSTQQIKRLLSQEGIVEGGH